MRLDQPGVIQADHHQKQSDTCPDSGKQFTGHHAHDSLPYTHEGKQHENHSRKEYDPERFLPTEAHALHDRVGKERVQSHAGRHRQRQAGPQSHGDRTDPAQQAGRKRRRHRRNTRIGENGRVHSDDVAHRQEGGCPGKDLCAHRCAEGREIEISFEAVQQGRHGAARWIGDVGACKAVPTVRRFRVRKLRRN